MQSVRLLLVEPDLLIADIAADALSDAGYEVVRAVDGAEAMELLAQGGGGLKGLITGVDVGVGASGWDLARSAREADPQMAVIYTAEAGGSDWPVEGVPNSLLIPQPYAVGQIVTAIALLLNHASAAVLPLTSS